MKSHTCIVCADAARARFFAVDTAVRSTGRTVTRLEEVLDLVNPARRSRPSERFSDSRPGSRQSGSAGHAVDDGRAASVEVEDRRFATEISSAIRSQLDALGAETLLLAASPDMLGHLRQVCEDLGIPARELDKDLTNLSASDLNSYLLDNGLLTPLD